MLRSTVQTHHAASLCFHVCLYPKTGTHFGETRFKLPTFSYHSLHKQATHNKHYNSFDDFHENVLDFMREIIPKTWKIYEIASQTVFASYQLKTA